jgi:aryl-alcohol dehydrogenase-like predicted oxidoreductase
MTGERVVRTGVSRRRFLGHLAVGAAWGMVGRAWAAGGPAMRTRPIPATGEPLPVIGLGTWQTFDVTPTPAALAPLEEVLRRFFAAGGRLVDTSPMYGRSELTLGELLPNVAGGDDAFVATKVWTTGTEAGREQMAASMRKLGVSRLDLMQVHNLLDLRRQLPTMRELKREGRIRYIGVTHHARSEFSELERLVRTADLDFVQLPYSIGFRDAEERLLPAAADAGVAVIVMRPFEGGSLFRQVRGRDLPEWAAEFDCSSWAQFFLKFLLGHPAVNCPIPATSNPDHVADNVRAGMGRFPDAALRRRMVAFFEG